MEGFKARFDIETITEGYGQTEITLPILTPYGADRPAGAAGLVVADWFDIGGGDSETDEEVPGQPWRTPRLGPRCRGFSERGRR